MRLSVAVQHHPARAHMLDPLLERLHGLTVEVVADPDPDGRASPWRTYRRALEQTPKRATHRLVIQDDAQPCDYFAEVLSAAIMARPDRLVVLCVCEVPYFAAAAVQDAAWRQQCWADIPTDSWLNVVAVVWPVRLIEPLLAHVDAQNYPAGFTADDEIVGRAIRGIGEQVRATVPSLVDHPDLVPSLVRNRLVAGARRAYCSVGDDCDPRTIDWAANSLS